MLSETDSSEDRYLNATEIEALIAAGVSIQSHGVSHTPLVQLSASEVESELRGSKQGLEQLTSREIRHYAYPIGRVDDFNQTHAKLVETVGYQAAFTAIAQPISDPLDLFQIPRLGTRESNRHLRRRLGAPF
ncbi:MAG: polysaccharide deacetylase family protein [Pseudomonadales bacterium]|nr:polysaccharide deacetylase family protein [Pseudomonadales bacterium]